MVSKFKIPVYRPDLSGNEKKYVNQCLDTSWISSRGNFVSKFEENFSDYIDVAKATSVSNGTVALHLALHAIGISKGDEVIVPSLTYVASANAITYVGATPVFADSSLEDWNLDIDSVISKITPKTRAILAVHLYGNPCDMDKLVDICKKHKLFLIEDAAEAFGSKFKDKHVGTFGDIATFSFFGNKTLTTGEGGMVVSNDEDLIKRCAYLKSQAVSLKKEYWHDELGFNYRMTNICAAIGVAQLEKANQTILKKRKLLEWYKEDLKNLPISFQVEQNNSFNSYWMASITLHESNQRNKLRKHLNDAGIETRPFFPLMHKLPLYNNGEILKNAEILEKSGINLPSFPLITPKELSYITNEIKSFFK
tara:strand:- start:1352 stop:2449 length:1098 start_codon:yes stop_codon:yes gene_type:complete